MVALSSVKHPVHHMIARQKQPSPEDVAKAIAEAGKRALAEAQAREAAARAQKPLPKEINGQAGPEPTRYGDWEKKGIISDF